MGNLPSIWEKKHSLKSFKCFSSLSPLHSSFFLTLITSYSLRPPIAALLTRFCCHRCEDDVNECDQEACGNGGECVNTFGSFYCNCSEGYEGQLCDDLTTGDPGDDTQVAYEQRLELDFCRCYRINEKIIMKTPRIVFLCIQLAPNWTWHTQWNWEFWVYSSPWKAYSPAWYLCSHSR